MIIRSEYLSEGLFGQVFVWMLEVLPYVQSRGWRPRFEIRTKNYGSPPSFEILPGIIEMVHAPEPSSESVSFEALHRKHKHSFCGDFTSAHEAWTSCFRFTDDVYQKLDDFWTRSLQDRTVLGVHYRGTDKNVDPYQTNPVTLYQFVCVIEDFLRTHPDIEAIFVASDDARFVEAMKWFPNVCSYEQERAADDQPLWNKHDARRNEETAKAAILDCLTLARCAYGLKCMSQLSAFSKVLNPDLKLYRVAACKPGWFPEAYVPVYTSKDPAVRALLRVLQQGDFQEDTWSRLGGLDRRISRVVRQVWQKNVTKRNVRQ